MPQQPVAMLIKLTLAADKADEFEQRLQEVLTKVRAEPTCLAIEGHRDPDDPTRFMLYELWSSRETFAEFEAGREYLADYMATVRPWWTQPRDLTVWEHVPH